MWGQWIRESIIILYGDIPRSLTRPQHQPAAGFLYFPFQEVKRLTRRVDQRCKCPGDMIAALIGAMAAKSTSSCLDCAFSMPGRGCWTPFFWSTVSQMSIHLKKDASTLQMSTRAGRLLLSSTTGKSSLAPRLEEDERKAVGWRDISDPSLIISWLSRVGTTAI